MDFVVDNAVPLSAIFLGVVVLGSLAVLGVAGWRAWKVVRAAQKRMTTAAAALAAEGERLSAATAALPERQAELQAALSSLQRRAAVLQVLGASASEAIAVLKSPLRYLGR